jgi:hypothetical protein
MKKTLRNLTAGVMLGACSLIPMKNANAQLSGSIETIKSSKPKNSYIRPCLFYDLPAGIKGFTFLEFYQKDKEKDEKSYFGRTKLTKEIIKGLGLRLDAVHGSGCPVNYGLGLNVNIPTKKVFTNFYLTPFFVNNKLKKIENKVLSGYFASTKLPFGLELNSFGEWNLNGKDGVEWTYGEVNLEKKFKQGKFSVAYNPALKNKGGPIPKLEHRVTARYYFK